MKLQLPQIYLSLCLAVLLVSFPASMVTAEVPRPTSITRPGQLSNPIKAPQVQKQNPSLKLQNGYCLVDGELEELEKQMCVRKRGTFFTDQRSAQRALDSQQGYCCNDGDVQRSKRSSCIRSKGAFFLRQDEATKECAATKGFCCNEGTVTPASKGDCDRKKGGFFTQKQEAVNLCTKQKGYCCKDGDVSASTQGACEKMRGIFSLKQRDAKTICDKQNGYCCEDGNVSRMNKGRCEQIKGTFSIRQAEVQLACSNERGFCCTDGKIVNSNRGVCEQKNGTFSSSRSEIAQTCNAVKRVKAQKPKTEITAAASPVQKQVENGTKKSPKLAPNNPKKFDDPLFVQKSERLQAQTISRLQQPDKTPRIAPGAPVNPNQLNGGQAVLSSAQAAGQIAGYNQQNIQTQGLGAIPEIKEKDPEVSLNATFKFNTNAYWYVHGVNEDRFFWAKPAVERAFAIKATLKGTLSCGTGTLQKADIFVLGGDAFFNVQEQTDAQGQFTLDDVTLMHMDQVRDSICSNGNAYFNQNKNLELVAELTCKNPAGATRVFQSEVKHIPIVLTCDRREVGNVPEKSIHQYRHTCPAGYHLEGFNVQSKLDSRGWNDPIPCVKN